MIESPTIPVTQHVTEHLTEQITAETNGSPVNAKQKSATKLLHTAGSVEGISFLLLLLVAMPLKYIGHNPVLVHWLGPIHGGLFLLYVASALAVARVLKWGWLALMLALISSVVPCGPFLFKAWLSRPSKSNA